MTFNGFKFSGGGLSPLLYYNTVQISLDFMSIMTWKLALFFSSIGLFIIYVKQSLPRFCRSITPRFNRKNTSVDTGGEIICTS